MSLENLKTRANLFFLSLFLLESQIGLALGGGGEFESRMKNLTELLINVVLPLVSVAGLLYAVFLAIMGDGAAKMRLWMVTICSIIGFLAPHLISFIKMASGY